MQKDKVSFLVLKGGKLKKHIMVVSLEFPGDNCGVKLHTKIGWLKLVAQET